MIKLNKLFFLIIFFAFANQLYAQSTGTIRGRIVSAETGEPVIAANVLVMGQSKGAATNIAGKFEIELEPGTYDLRFSFVSYATKIVRNVAVNPGEVTVLGTVQLQESTETLENLVVTAEAVESNNEIAFVNKMQNSIQTISGISSEFMSELGVSKASGALKKVSGVTVEGGKYVHVRGLGDRYTDVMLNSITIPSLAPNKNTVPVDLFPTSLISNIVVSKTAVASMPADFAGGIVNIITKDFPVRPVREFSVSVGYNPLMHFNSNYLSYGGGNLDALGFGAEARSLPEGARGDIPLALFDPRNEVFNFVNRFDPTLAANESNNLVNYSLGLSLGNQFEVGSDNNIGYIFSVNYKKSTKHYNNYRVGEYQNQLDPEAYRLILAQRRSGTLSKSDVFWSAMAGLAYKTQNTKLQLTALRLQNGVSSAGNFSVSNNGAAAGQSGYQAELYTIGYSQRSITSVLLHGTHYFRGNSWEIDWKISPTLSKIVHPDLRTTAFTIVDTDDERYFEFQSGAGGFPSRSWRFMNEINLVNRLDITKNYSLFGNDAELKFGGSYVYKQRDYEILKYGLAFEGGKPGFREGDPSVILNDENIYGNGGSIFYTAFQDETNSNAYKSNANKISAYASTLFRPASGLSLYVGLRAENFVLRHTGRSAGGSIFLDNEIVLESFKLFPSTNMKLALTDNMYLRLAYYKTIARPTFKEMSFAQITDPISGRIFNGGLFAIGNWDGNLRETNIHNFDLGWQWYLGQGQLLSTTFFYKTFDAPIEMVRLLVSATSVQIQPRNVGSGRTLGVEFQVKKSLGFISPSLSNFKINGNVTLIQSAIDMTEQEYQARVEYAKEGQEVDDTRPMAGQAPIVINTGITYDNPDIGLNAGLFYNVQGETLVIVGGGLSPDIYSQPFHNLSFNLSKSFGRASVTFSAENILNDSHALAFENFRSQEAFYEYYNRGRTISVGFKYSF